jgi:hypothetical protein
MANEIKDVLSMLVLSQRHLHATASPLDALMLKSRSPQEE